MYLLKNKMHLSVYITPHGIKIKHNYHLNNNTMFIAYSYNQVSTVFVYGTTSFSVNHKAISLLADSTASDP